MDIIDQLFPPAQTDDTVAGLYQQGRQPWEILQSVHNETAHEVVGSVRDSVFRCSPGFLTNEIQSVPHLTPLETFADLHVENPHVLVAQGAVDAFRIEAQYQQKLLLVDHDTLVDDDTVLAGHRNVLLVNGQAELEHPVTHGGVTWRLAELFSKDIPECVDYLDDCAQTTVGSGIRQHAQHNHLNRVSMSWNRVERNLRCSSLSAIVGTSFFLSSFFSFLISALSASFWDLSFDLSLEFSFRSLYFFTTYQKST